MCGSWNLAGSHFFSSKKGTRCAARQPLGRRNMNSLYNSEDFAAIIARNANTFEAIRARLEIIGEQCNFASRILYEFCVTTDLERRAVASLQGALDQFVLTARDFVETIASQAPYHEARSEPFRVPTAVPPRSPSGRSLPAVDPFLPSSHPQSSFQHVSRDSRPHRGDKRSHFEKPQPQTRISTPSALPSPSPSSSIFSINSHISTPSIPDTPFLISPFDFLPSSEPSPTIPIFTTQLSNTSALKHQTTLTQADSKQDISTSLVSSSKADIQSKVPTKRGPRYSAVPRKRSKTPNICSECNVESTPHWRFTEDGQRLCNACGLAYLGRKKKAKEAAAISKANRGSIASILN